MNKSSVFVFVAASILVVMSFSSFGVTALNGVAAGWEKNTTCSFGKEEQHFEAKDFVSKDQNTYSVPRFVEYDVEQENQEQNRYFSSKNGMALTVEIYEDKEMTIDEVIETSLGYIKNNIVSNDVLEKTKDKAYYVVEYDLMGEKKIKDIICLTSKNGIILYDLSLFDEEEGSGLAGIREEFLRWCKSNYNN